MIEVNIERVNNMVILDGFSTKDTLDEAIKDLAEEVAKIDSAEADAILHNLSETVAMVKEGMNDIPDAYFIEATKVGCGVRFNEETFQLDYYDAKWYLFIRFFDETSDCEIYSPDMVQEDIRERLNEVVNEIVRLKRELNKITTAEQRNELYGLLDECMYGMEEIQADAYKRGYVIIRWDCCYQVHKGVNR